MAVSALCWAKLSMQTMPPGGFDIGTSLQSLWKSISLSSILRTFGLSLSFELIVGGVVALVLVKSA